MAFTARRGMVAMAVLAIALAALTSCGSGSASATGHDAALPLAVPHHVTVGTRPVPGLGTVLVDGQGRSLYLFPPDAAARVSCTGPCAGTWPPLVIAAGDKPVAGAGAERTLLSTLPDPNTGARVVTYNGHPLYRYAGDVRAGTADGQALFLNGGPWYVLDPAGDPVTADTGGDR